MQFLQLNLLILMTIVNIQQQPTRIARMDLEVSCSRCSKQYSDSNLPKILTCGHTYCQMCLGQLSQEHQSESIKIICPEDSKEVIVAKIDSLPVNKSLLTIVEVRRNNTSCRSIHSLKDQSFNVPKINRSYQEDDDAEALITAIDQKSGHSHNRGKSQCFVIPSSLNSKLSDENEFCLLHNKQIEIICLVDFQRLCSKCALFGQHKGHQFVGLDHVQQGNRKIYQTLLQIFDEKVAILDKLKKENQSLIDPLLSKSTVLKKEISDKFKKIHDQISKAEKAAYHRLQEMVDNAGEKIKKLLVIDEKTLDAYQSWTSTTLKKCTHEGLLQFYLGGKNLIDSGREIVAELKFQEEKSKIQSKKLTQEIGVLFNQTPCLNSLSKMVQFYESEKEYEKKIEYVNIEKQHSKLFASCQIYEDIQKKVRTQAHQDDESLLELVDEFEPGHSKIGSMILNESLIKLPQKSTPTRMIKTSTLTGTPSKLGPRKKVMTLNKEVSKEEKPKQQKKELPITRDTLKKKMKSIKIPEKYQKVFEGIVADTSQTVDFTNAELGDAVAIQICEVLKGNIRPKTLKLIRNKITDEGFIKMLPLLTGIITLNFSQNLLTQNCLNIISELRGSLPLLKNIILSQNKIAERKCKPLIEKLRKMDLVISI